MENSKPSDDIVFVSKLHKAIFDLPEKYRTPLLMKYHQAMSIDEISTTLATKPRAIKNSIIRGSKLLGKIISSEKNPISLLTAANLISTITFPLPNFDVSFSTIKNTQTTNPFVTKAFKKSQYSSSFIMKCLSTIAVSAIITVGLIFLYSNANAQPTQFNKTYWDFSRENGDDLKNIRSLVKYNKSSNSITNEIKNFDNPIPVVFKLQSMMASPSKIVIKAKINTERGMTPIETYHNTLEYIPILKNNVPLIGSQLYFNPPSIDKSEVDKNNRIQNNLTFYSFENICIIFSEKYNRITKIHRFDGLNETPNIGFIVANFDIESIEIIPLEEPELIQIKNKALAILNRQNK